MRLRVWVWLWLWMGAVAAFGAVEIPNILWKTPSSNSLSLSAAISHDGTLAITTDTNGMQVRRMADGTLIREIPAADYVRGLVFSPDDSLVALSSWQRNVKLWRTSDWSNTVTIATYNEFSPVAFSPSGDFIAIGNRTNIELRLVTDGSLLRSWPATNRGGINALSFSPDGRRLASGSGFRGTDTHLKIWDTETSALLVDVPTAQTYGIGCLAYSPDGRFIATGNFIYGFYGPMQLWRADNGALVRTYPDDVTSLAFSPDSKLLLAAGTNVVCWAIEENVRIAVSPGFNPFKIASALAFSPDGGKFLFSLSLGPSPGTIAAKTPLWIASVSRSGNVTGLSWLGGQSAFVVQRRIETNGHWENASELLETNTIKLKDVSGRELYRVVSIERD